MLLCQHFEIPNFLPQERIEYSKTLKGKYFNIMGYVFSMYCLWKITICTVNIIFDRVGKTDPVTKGVEIAVHWLGIEFDVSDAPQIDVSFIYYVIIIIIGFNKKNSNIAARGLNWV